MQTLPNSDGKGFSADELGAILDSLIGEVVVLDTAGVILACNEPWREFASAKSPGSGKVSRGIEIGDNFLAVFAPRPGYTPDDNTARALRGIEAVLRGALPRFELEVPCPNLQEMRWYLLCATPLLPRGQGAVVSYIDITKRINAETVRLIDEGNSRNFERTKSLSLMAGSVAHHINNHLQNVLLKLELATRDNSPKNDKVEQALVSAIRSTRKAADISNQMRLYSGSSRENEKTLDLATFCRKNLDLQRSSLPSGVSLEIDLPSRGPNICADEDQIGQLLSNLITNAWEAGGNERHTIRVSLKSTSAAEIPAANRFPAEDRKSTRLNSSHITRSRMPSSA